MSLNNNDLQFITLALVKSHFNFIDNQDDNTLLSIIQACNLEIKKRITPIVDDLDAIPSSIFFQPGQDAALVYCEAEKLRKINKQHDKAKSTMETFETMMKSYIGSLRAQSPTRTGRQIASRDIDPEDNYFSQRHII